MSEPGDSRDHVEFAQGLATLRAAGRGLRRRIEQEATRPVQRLLIVEDDLLMRALLCATLSPESYDIAEAGTAAEALRLLQDDAPSLVILDVRLPDRSGLEVCRAMRADPRLSDVPVIAVSALADDSAVEAGRVAGIDRYLTKPFSPLQLLRTVEDLVCS